jgi:hypothetical protein
MCDADVETEGTETREGSEPPFPPPFAPFLCFHVV